MAKNKLNTQLSANSAFLSFVVLSLLLSVLVSAVFVGFTTDKNMRQYEINNAKIEAKLSASYIQQFVETRLQLLHDLAKQPILVNGVMGSDVSAASLSDYLDDYHLVGKKHPIWLVNIASELVYSNSEAGPTDLNAPWLAQLLSENVTQVVTLNTLQSDEHFLIAVPVKYNGFTEGVMIVEFRYSLAELFQDVINSANYGVTLSGQWLNFSSLTDSTEYFSVVKLSLGNTGLTLNYHLNMQLIEQRVMAVIIKIASSIFISLMVAWTVLYLVGHRLLLDPYRRLAASERAIKLSEERYKVAVAGSNDGLWDWDIKAGTVYYAPRYKELLGYSADDEAFPDTFASFENALHPDDKERVNKAIEQHLKQKHPYDIEYRLRIKSGEYRFYRARGTAIWDENGNATRMAGSLTDVTVQKRDQQALQQAKEHNDLLAQAIEACNLGISISDAKDPTNPLIFINSGFKKITGYGEEILGRNCRFLQGDETDKQAITDVRTAIANKSKFRVELINYRKDGSKFWNSLQISPVFDNNQKLIAFVGIQQDVTERIEINKALELAKHQAENANKAKSEFLASMSHEIRTPMNGVLGMLNLLQTSELSKEQLHRVNVAIGSANALLNLLNDILDFSKIDAGKLELESIEFDLRTLFGEFAEAAAIQAHQKNLELILDITNVNAQTVMGDPNRLRQILYNLVGNAIKFTAQGEVVIKAALEVKGSDQYLLNCEVNDTGIGIPEQQQSKLFKTFSQVDASTTRKYGGTGLGLAIVKQLCELMGGSIEVSSNEGEGSSFKFCLILGCGSGAKASIPSIDISKLHILIVDDNKTNLDVLRGQFEFWGARVTEALSADEAILACEDYFETHQRCFDIAFLDMQMPNVDGAQLGKAIKQHADFHATKLVMMTSMNHQGDASYFADLGFAGYFPKPATTSDLLDALSIVVEGGDALEQATPLVTRHYIQTLQTQAKSEQVKWANNIRLLLAEDNQVNQIVAKSTLTKLGLTDVKIASNGQEVLNILNESEDSFTAILMDCQMPELDGYDATKAIRNGKAGEHNTRIPIIAMTANAMIGDREKCISAGMDDYITKPIVEANLKTKLRAWLPEEKES